MHNNTINFITITQISTYFNKFVASYDSDFIPKLKSFPGENLFPLLGVLPTTAILVINVNVSEITYS